jgi:hypothetical protein
MGLRQTIGNGLVTAGLLGVILCIASGAASFKHGDRVRQKISQEIAIAKKYDQIADTSSLKEDSKKCDKMMMDFTVGVGICGSVSLGGYALGYERRKNINI